MTKIALFPIPSCVAFPGTIFPLHVFEPRYRAMVNHCVNGEIPMGICHTQKILHQSKAGQSVEDALQSNQATYKPHTIFSAGFCELKQILDDGRMLVHVQLQHRYRAIQEIQTLPFSIYQCELYEDEKNESHTYDDLLLQKEKVLKRLLAITADATEVQQLLRSEDWQNKDPHVFSLELFGVLRLEPDLQQFILECRSPFERLHTVLELLNQPRP